MQNVLITGGAGFIGSTFVRFLLGNEPGVRAVNLDALTYAGSLENVRDFSDDRRHLFVKGDVCDAGLVGTLLREHRIDTIVHFAAETHVDRSILEPRHFVQTNVIGTFTLLEQARKFWLQEKALPADAVRFHHISTDEVFGGLAPDEPACAEDAPYAPNSPYAASKAAGDHLVRAYGHTYGLPFSVSNCSNNYGPYQFPEKLIPLMILNAMEGKPLPVYGDGGQIRDWLHVQDHCDAIHRILMGKTAGESYNIGGGNQAANITIVETVCELLDEMLPESRYRPHKGLVQYVEDRPGHDRRYAMNIAKIRNELGWEPRHTLAQGLRETVAWFLAHLDWVATIRGQATYQSWLAENYGSRGQDGSK